MQQPYIKNPRYANRIKSFLEFEVGLNITQGNWKGECPFPFWVPENMQRESWFQPFLQHLQRVNLSNSHYPYKKMEDCSRWWHVNPQYLHIDPIAPGKPYLGQRNLDEWHPKPKPPTGYIRPKCEGFGRQSAPQTSCGTKQEQLWRALDDLGVVYFPRAGTELGITRGSGYIATDGDLDIHVDMPQKKLLRELSKVLSPAPYLSEAKDPFWFKTGVHWQMSGWLTSCPTAHLQFHDWMENAMTRNDLSMKTTYKDVCECLMNSVPLSCHKESVYRTWLFYGPSWRVPLHAKALDIPHRARHYNIVGKLQGMLSKDGVIHEQAVRYLDTTIRYTIAEMQMILAQLNELHALITCQNDSNCREKLMWY